MRRNASTRDGFRWVSLLNRNGCCTHSIDGALFHRPTFSHRVNNTLVHSSSGLVVRVYEYNCSVRLDNPCDLFRCISAQWRASAPCLASFVFPLPIPPIDFDSDLAADVRRQHSFKGQLCFIVNATMPPRMFRFAEKQLIFRRVIHTPPSIGG